MINSISINIKFLDIQEEKEGEMIENIDEIKTSREEFLRKLRYFKNKSNEINHQKEIFIHENCPAQIFKEFISTITTNKITLNDDNYKMIKHLSDKYGYDELTSAVSKYSKERPDIVQAIEEYSKHDIDEEREEEIAKHLDICLQNKSMLDIPICILNRILNSPKRFLRDHHLLFNFIKNKLDQMNRNKNERSENKNKQNENNYNDKENEENEDEEEYERVERENIEILISSLDFNQMSKEEMKEIFNHEYFDCIFNPRGIKEKMKTILRDTEYQEERMNSLEQQINKLHKSNKEFEEQYNHNENKQSEEITKMRNEIKRLNEQLTKYEIEHKRQTEQQHQQQEIQIISLKELINQIQHKNSYEIQNQQKQIETQESLMSTLKEIIYQNQSKFEEQQQKQRKIIETLEKKIKELEEINNNKTKLEEIQQKLKDNQAKQIDDLENKINQFIKNNQLKGTLTVSVQENQIITGKIDIIEEGSTLDRKRSKYILNTDQSPILGRSSYEKGYSIEKLSQEIIFKKRSGTYYLHALLVDNFGQEKEIVSEGVSTKGFCLNYEFTGKVATATLEAGTYKLEVWGAEGGKNGLYFDSADKGGYSVGTLKLNKKTKLFIHVGESPTNQNGGWNGGGSGTQFCDREPAPGGGGSTDISLYGEEGCSNWNNKNHLYSRIIVAGAGGGSASKSRSDWFGGFGGGVNGGCSGHNTCENEGTQTRAGINISYSTGQGFGIGGTHTGEGSSGGGGGWYGGGASDVKTNSTGGSGGSGYVYNSSTASNYPSGCKLDSSFYLTESKTISGNKEFPSPTNSRREKGHSGHGYARITFE